MKTQEKHRPIHEEIDADMLQALVPEVHVVKGKKRRHKRDGCGGGGGGGPITTGLGVGPLLAGLFGNPPSDFEIVKAARDIPPGAIIQDRDLEDISALELQQQGGKITRDMTTRSMVKNMRAGEKIPKGRFLKVNRVTGKVIPIQ